MLSKIRTALVFGQLLKRNVKLLGVILDKKLTFQSHIEAVEKKALKALGALMMVGKTEKINPANMIKLFKSLVVPHLEYAASVWQIGECDKLEKIQRKDSEKRPSSMPWLSEYSKL